MQEQEVDRFEGGDLDPSSFDHAAHVRVGHALVRDLGFIAALPRYAAGLRLMSARVGRPERFHATVTTAFLALIGERLLTRPAATFEAFATDNPDLFNRDCLLGLYSADRLNSPAARTTFLLPKPGQVPGQGGR